MYRASGDHRPLLLRELHFSILQVFSSRQNINRPPRPPLQTHSRRISRHRQPLHGRTPLRIDEAKIWLRLLVLRIFEDWQAQVDARSDSDRGARRHTGAGRSEAPS